MDDDTNVAAERTSIIKRDTNQFQDFYVHILERFQMKFRGTPIFETSVKERVLSTPHLDGESSYDHLSRMVSRSSPEEGPAPNKLDRKYVENLSKGLSIGTPPQ